MYFCTGFFIYDHSEPLKKQNLKLIHDVGNAFVLNFYSFRYDVQEIQNLLQLSFSALLSEKGEFEENCFIFYYDALPHNPHVFGVMHCLDQAIDRDSGYVWSFTPGMQVIKSGDPFLSPISEKFTSIGNESWIS
ncbi:MAG: hypothetical protein AB7I41_20600 [Candidatus Sericytochromatia bacterium]